MLLYYYQSLISVIMQAQAAMFWWPLPLSAYLIRLVTAAEGMNEEWKMLPLSQQHHSHLGNISLSIINTTFQISPINQSCNSWTLFMHAHWHGSFRDTVQNHRPVGRNHSRYCSKCRRVHRLFNRLQSYAWSLHFIKQDKVNSLGKGICFTGIRGTLRH